MLFESRFKSFRTCAARYAHCGPLPELRANRTNLFALPFYPICFSLLRTLEHMASPLSDSEGRAYVNQRPGGEPQARPRVSVSLQFADPKLTAASSTALPKWYHLNRDATEPLQASLARLRLNIIANRLKQSKKGAHRKGTKSSRAKLDDTTGFSSAAAASAAAADPDALPAAAENALSEALNSFKITKRGVELAPTPRSKTKPADEEPATTHQQNADDDASAPSYLLSDPANADIRIALFQSGHPVCLLYFWFSIIF